MYFLCALGDELEQLLELVTVSPELEEVQVIPFIRDNKRLRVSDMDLNITFLTMHIYYVNVRVPEKVCEALEIVSCINLS